MNVLLVMIPLSLLLVFVAGVAFFWAVNHDQFDDMDSPALLPVSDDLPEPEPTPKPEPESESESEPEPEPEPEPDAATARE